MLSRRLMARVMESGPQEMVVQEQLHLLDLEGAGFGGAFDDVGSFQ